MVFNLSCIKREFPSLDDPTLHYLDNAAMTQSPQAVIDAAVEFERTARANVLEPGHRLAHRAVEAYAGAREAVARYINASDAGEVVFTAGATSALNLAAYSLGASLQPGDEVVLSVMEHHSNLVPWQLMAKRNGVSLRFLPVTPEGRLDMEALPEIVGDRCRLIAITHCSNVTGAITDFAPIVDAARSVGASVLVDGAQQIPHAPIDVAALGVDFYAFSGHKMYGPTGIGVLWGRKTLLEAMPPLLSGGHMTCEVTLEEAIFEDPPRRFEAGTPPIAAAIGLGAAVDWIGDTLNWTAMDVIERHLTRRLLDGLARVGGARILGPTDTRDRRGVVSFVIDNVDMRDLCRLLDDHGVAARYGDHCAQPLLRAFGVAEAMRVSVGVYNGDGDIDAFLEGLEDALWWLRKN
ncbi:MAG: cysteine desulfurase [Rhodospirillaceae bacterium]|jgi:cysteine desulfurase / selenocysteine lyase|nr:cysteine desulfurase [Rhodospirillaceae bacterium]MBT5810404.1 cysteine desulfurase [Rhodospirillaceae bacterium]